MIGIEFSATNVVTLTPHGSLSAQDFSQLKAAIDDYINNADKVPNLVIHMGQLPHWGSIEALTKHLQFVREHHRLVQKVAIVGDGLAVSTLPILMDRFVVAKVRHFSETKLNDARQWAEASNDHPGHFDLLEGFPADVIAIKARGIITAQDYSGMLVPLVDEKLRTHDRLKVLFILDGTFDAYTGAAAWDDARLGLTHWKDFARIAVVTDIGWIRHGTRILGPMMKADVRVFANAEFAEATEWIKR